MLRLRMRGFRPPLPELCDFVKLKIRVSSFPNVCCYWVKGKQAVNSRTGYCGKSVGDRTAARL